jgi:hypothetical protein
MSRTFRIRTVPGSGSGAGEAALAVCRHRMSDRQLTTLVEIILGE